jgi:hypothetical protein
MYFRRGSGSVVLFRGCGSEGGVIGLGRCMDVADGLPENTEGRLLVIDIESCMVGYRGLVCRYAARLHGM